MGFEGTVKIGGRSAANLRCADDIVIVGDSMEELQDIVSRIHEASSQEGLYLNTRTTKVMKPLCEINETTYLLTGKI